MRVSIDKAFIQPTLNWSVLEPKLLDGALPADVVAELREQVPSLARLTQTAFEQAGLSKRDSRMVVALAERARDAIETEQKSSLVRLMGRSRGWVHGTRTKVFLTLLWKQQTGQLAAGPTDIADLVEHTSVDRRSVNQAVRDLCDMGFIRTEFRDRDPRSDRKDHTRTEPVQVRGSQIELRSVLGDGTPYRRPAAGEFFQIGEELWAEGWMRRLSGQGLAVLLVLLNRIDSRDPTAGIWVAMSKVRNWYGFSDKVWHTGVKNLTEDLKLIRKRPVKAEADDANELIDRRRFYAPDSLKHPWLVSETPQADDETGQGGFPEGANVLYLAQRTRLAISFREAVERLTVEYEIARGPVEQFEQAREVVRFAKDELNSEQHAEQAKELLRAWCQILISHSDAYLQARKRKKPGAAHEGYRLLVDLLDHHDEEYERALTLASEARDKGWGRTKADPATWDKTIERLDRAARRQAARARVRERPDGELWSPVTTPAEG